MSVGIISVERIMQITSARSGNISQNTDGSNQDPCSKLMKLFNTNSGIPVKHRFVTELHTETG